MTTVRLPEMVEMVSSILKEYPVDTQTLYNQGVIIITTPIWDFYFKKIDNQGCYFFDDTKINNAKLAKELEHTRKTITRQAVSKYCVTTSL
jgi:hypothetical protein